MSVYLLDGQVLLDGGQVAVSENCCCGDCPCQPTHIITHWSMTADCGPGGCETCNTFTDSWNDEQDIPPLEFSNVPPCFWNGTFEHTINVDGCCGFTVASEIFLNYDTGSGMWKLLLDIFFPGVILSKDGLGNGYYFFACPPVSDGFDLTWSAIPCLSGRVDFEIT